MEVLLGNILGSIIGIGIGLVFVIPLLILVFGTGLAGMLKVLGSILG